MSGCVSAAPARRLRECKRPGLNSSAAIYGVRSKPAITIFMLYPDGRISPVQLDQMATVPDANVYVVAVEDADFDACQSIVKTLFSDADFNKAHRLGAVNSINWARILAQIVYYFSAYFQLPEAKREKVQFVVPTGNFGDILAGYYAKRLGLPMGELVVATNENDILERFFRTGRYAREDLPDEDVAQAAETAAVNGSSDGAQATGSDAGVKVTHSPAMDIMLSSNFERLLYYLAEETGSGDRAEAQATLKGWMDTLKKDGQVDLGKKVQAAGSRDFWAERVSDEQASEGGSSHRRATDPLDPRADPKVLRPRRLVRRRSAHRRRPRGPGPVRQEVVRR